MIGKVYHFRRQWLQAEALEAHVMDTRKTKLGIDRPDTLTSMNNLAFTSKGSGFTSRTIFLMEEYCKLGSIVFGPQHPSMISFHEVLKVWRLEALQHQEQMES